MSSSFEKIAIFGGTFDPPHLAHTRIIALASQQLKLDRVICIPCRQSPHKQERVPASATDRLAMLARAAKDLPQSSISNIELNREGLSYSIDTVIEIRKEFPDAQLYWIMGSDQWEVLDTWYQSEELAKMLEFIVFPRPHIPSSQAGKKLHIVDSRIDISSSFIRECIRNKKDVSKYLAADVAAYIKEKGLYL